MTKKKIFFILSLCIIVWNGKCYASEGTDFAVIGDYGYAGSAELAVSNLVKSWYPDFIITLGDNNYNNGQYETIDTNIGKYYHEFIYPYFGSYGAGDTVNRFFPSLGNHDWYTLNAQPYLDYFTLPGNERYYDFIKGNVHFFSIDSDHNEPDGRDSSSVQAMWLKNALYNSSSDYNIVYFHHAPYSSSSSHGSDQEMQWPFKQWGASVVLAGHDHTYERIFRDSMTYIVNGLGGRSIYSFGTPVQGSVIRYNNNYGAMIVRAYDDSLVSRFYSISGNLRDYFILYPKLKRLNLTVFIEGMYNPVSGLMKSDTVQLKIRSMTSPYSVIDAGYGYADEAGNCSLSFNELKNATPYYLSVNHKNSLETWSAVTLDFRLGKLQFDFSADSSVAYGNNLTLKGSKYCIYSGDVNRDGLIDATDNQIIDNLSYEFATGYIQSDLNGDEFVDASDLVISENNSAMFIHSIFP